MRKVEQHVCGAFVRGERAVRGNTASDGERLTLHGNVIAERDPHGIIRITLAGWPTVTTRSRLHAVCQLAETGVRVFQERGEQYIQRPNSSPDVMNPDSWYQIN